MHYRDERETPPLRQLFKGKQIKNPAHVPDSPFHCPGHSRRQDPKLFIPEQAMGWSSQSPYTHPTDPGCLHRPSMLTLTPRLTWAAELNKFKN